MYWDTGDQLAQFFGISAFGMPAGQIWDHHPWFSTFLFGWLTKIGHSLTGSYTFGLMINAAIQYTIVAIELSWIVSFLSTKGLRGKGLTALCLFMCFFPPLPILCAAMSKDVINAVAFLGWIILFYRLAESGLNLLKKPSFLLSFIVVTLVVSLTKKIGMYLVIASLVALLVFHFSIKLKLAVVVFTFSLVLVCNGILPTYLYPALNIVPGGSQAALAMPIQLLARVARDYPEDITEEERTVIDSCLLFSTDEMGANYNPYITDPVTGFNTKKPIPMGSFLKIWLQVGLRHPLTYLNAFFSLESGWITFSGAPSIGTSQKIASEQYPILLEPVFCSTANKDTFGKLQTPKSQSWRQDIIEQLYRLISRLPIANIFCYVATWTSILPAFALFEYLRKCKHDKRCLIVLIPYFISALSLFVYPVSLSAQNDNPTRYMFHMILLAPLVFGFVLTCMKAKPSSQQNTLSTHATTEPQNRQ